METKKAREIGQQAKLLVEANQTEKAYALLIPILNARTPFRLLDCIGAAIGAAPLADISLLVKRIADDRTEGGWVVMASALGQHVNSDRARVFELVKSYIVAADIWYAPDIFGERVPGPSLLADFEPTLTALAPWREDKNRWVRRCIGVVVHFWAKRTRDISEYSNAAQVLLDFVDPMFEERDMDAVKGIGWGLKTMGRFYPDITAAWLTHQIVFYKRRPRALMLSKALTYFPKEKRANIVGGGF
jgi:hypothetical protein